MSVIDEVDDLIVRRLTTDLPEYIESVINDGFVDTGKLESDLSTYANFMINEVNYAFITGLSSGLSLYIGTQIGHDHRELLLIINDYFKTRPMRTDGKKCESLTAPTKSFIALERQNAKGEKVCPFKITKGAKQGQTCGAVIKGGEDYDFCSKHRTRNAPKKDVSTL